MHMAKPSMGAEKSPSWTENQKGEWMNDCEWISLTSTHLWVSLFSHTTSVSPEPGYDSAATLRPLVFIEVVNKICVFFCSETGLQSKVRTTRLDLHVQLGKNAFCVWLLLPVELIWWRGSLRGDYLRCCTTKDDAIM